ncbi:hypothetical protein ACHAQA_000116 [Verticillium albo-atrum]
MRPHRPYIHKRNPIDQSKHYYDYLDFELFYNVDIDYQLYNIVDFNDEPYYINQLHDIHIDNELHNVQTNHKLYDVHINHKLHDIYIDEFHDIYINNELYDVYIDDKLHNVQNNYELHDVYIDNKLLNIDHINYINHIDIDNVNVHQGVTLSSVDITSGAQTVIRTNIVPGAASVNALGYNAREDYLYAITQNTAITAVSIIRINARGDVTTAVAQVANKLPLLGIFNTGDIDENSQYWISSSGDDWFQYDFRPGSATYGQQVGFENLPVTARPSQYIADWAYVPGGGNFLWAIGTATTGRSVLMQFSRATKRWTQVRDFGLIVGSLTNQPVWGAAYASADGFLYGGENNSGQVWRFPVLSTTAAPVRLATGPTTSSNDGARCLEAANLPT